MTCGLASWLEASPNSPLDVCLGDSEAHVWRLALEHQQVNWDATWSVLSAEERHRAASYKRAIDRDRFARTRGALRLLLAQYCDVAPQRLEWCVSAEGKPRLDETCTTRLVEFNVSHSGQMALIAVGRRRVGVDVERIRPGVDCLAIARRYFSPLEVAELATLSGEPLAGGFFRCWTRKEAVVKASGKGIASGLAGFSVSLLPDVPPKLITQPSGDATRWQLFDVSPAEGYAAALATEGAERIALKCRTWTLWG